tara:strand:- start:2021 stop:2866 length:846 start_codon:yes stop_codon:yes gene_type:complete
MSESVISPAPTATSFGRRNASEERIKQTEDEIAALKNPTPAEVDPEEGEAIGGEEKTFKKRYGDLRRHSQKVQEDMQKQLDEVKAQLTKSAQKEMKLPKTDEELQSWASEYPDVYALVKTIAMQQAKEQNTGIEDRFKKLDELEKKSSKEKAEADLMQMHPDFNDIRDEDEFHDWVTEQPKYIQDALYENDNDAKAAGRAIDLYKADKGIKTKKAGADKEAATAIAARRGRTAPSSENTEGLIYESQVDKMSSEQYEKNAEAINTAMRAGKFVYDMSGAAR